MIKHSSAKRMMDFMIMFYCCVLLFCTQVS